MPDSLSSLVDYLAEDIKKDIKLNARDCICYLEYVEIKEKILQLKWLRCDKNPEKKFNVNLILQP